MQRKKNRKSKIAILLLIGISAILLCLLLVLHNFFYLLYNEQFYYKEFTKNGVDFGGYEKNATLMLFSYFQGKTSADEFGDFFSQKEKLHLADVEGLIDTAKFLYYSSAILLAALLAAMYLLNKDKFFKNIAKLFIVSGALMLLLLGIFALLLTNFESSFIGFHKLLFSNDLWLLNPATDHLIQLFPEQFFVDFVQVLAVQLGIAAGIMVVSGVAIYFYSRKKLNYA
jgi:integral membrane protein (TIGR01906 family)